MEAKEERKREVGQWEGVEEEVLDQYHRGLEPKRDWNLQQVWYEN